MWNNSENSLHQKFTFKDFKVAFSFMTKVAAEAEKLNHHPKWTNIYNTVEFWLNTHDAGDTVTKKDQELAAKIDEVYASFK